MPWLSTWAPYFQTRARQRGATYYHDGRVKRLPPEPDQLIHAQVVTKTDTYTVTLRSTGPATTATCTCDDVTSGSFCRHIWCTLMAVREKDGPFTPDAGPADLPNPRPPRAQKRAERPALKRQAQAEWSTRLDMIRPTRLEAQRSAPTLPAFDQVCYFILPRLSVRYHALAIELRHRHATPSGFSRAKRIKINRGSLDSISDPRDRHLCALLLGAVPGHAHAHDDDHETHTDDALTTRFLLPPAAQRDLLGQLVETGRCFLLNHNDTDDDDDLYTPLTWDDRETWQLSLVGNRTDEQLQLTLELRHEDRRLCIEDPSLLLPGPTGIIIHDHRATPFDDCAAFSWVSQFHDAHAEVDQSPSFTVPADDIPKFLDRLYRMPDLPRLELPVDTAYAETHVTPVPHLALTRSDAAEQSSQRHAYVANLWFDYRGHRVKVGRPGWFIAAIDPPNHHTPTPEPADNQPSTTDHEPTLIHRDLAFESGALASLTPLGFRRNSSIAPDAPPLLLPNRHMSDAVSHLIAQGWIITADDKVLRNPATPTLSVATGIDWFELRGTVRYGTTQGYEDVSLPDILAAARAGHTAVTLSDGSQGMLPQHWLDQHSLLAAIGKTHPDHIRFKSTQAMILDILLSKQTAVNVDEKFDTLRQRLHEFQGISSVEPAPSFQGDLRTYQKQGLGWLRYLDQLTVGGILADDMGLGKTVQILAMLDEFYSRSNNNDNPASPGQEHVDSQIANADSPESQDNTPLPSLIVVPRSIIFNWLDEAAHFTPNLRAQAYTGTDRHTLRDAFKDHHVIVTSYGLLRRDIADLSKHRFEYVVLDEAQVIKNPGSQSAKAARLLEANHRLALTGTPIENHLGDLWSIFEFLNPGMLGSNARFAKLIRAAGKAAHRRITSEPDAAHPEKATRIMQIAQALKPFVLRRTKKQVLKDLPEKTEQTILCQMEPHQRQTYDQLLKHYRATLLGKPADKAATGQTMIVLEALLRLRQAACHPGLIDPTRADESSAKLDVLIDRLHDLIDEGHKALVFSQFTSMLAIVRNRLDARSVVYEYLDGQTRDRAQRVQRFQNDPHCPVFLISLKAGGLGLNLTAAEYVFILDPWWNPAVEAQAIDRAHRIGQTQHVFAYRLICQDTVEQRIAQLQQRKRTLADAIMDPQQENIMRSLSRQDLQFLLT